MNTFLNKEFRLTFAGALFDLLREPKCIRYRPQASTFSRAMKCSDKIIVVEGKIALHEHGENGESVVGIELWVGPDWMTRFPLVFTDAAFLRSEIDWHVPIGNNLCCALDQQWHSKIDEISASEFDSNTLIALASKWAHLDTAPD